MAKLTPKQKRFCDEYLIDLNATQAAIRAGYSKKTARFIATENLTKPNIQAYLEKRMRKREERTEITQDRVLKEFAKIAFLDPRNFFNEDGSPKKMNELDNDTAAALAGMDVLEEYEGYGDARIFVGYTKKYKIADKLKALESLGRHLGLFNDKTEITGTVNVNNPMADLSTEELRKIVKELKKL